MSLLFGLALVLVATTSTDEPWVVAGAGLGGLLMFVAGAAEAFGATRRSFTAQRRLHVLADEVALLGARRELAGRALPSYAAQGAPRWLLG